MDSENTIEKDNKETASEYLKRMKEMGYLFHGTGNPQIIEKLEPRETVDTTGNEWNSDTAVFASGDPVWSVIFALYKGKSSWGTAVTTNENGDITKIVARINEKYKDSLPLEKGYVYVLPPETFQRENNRGAQHKSKSIVTPVASVEVTYEDYLNMGGEVVWTQ